MSHDRQRRPDPHALPPPGAGAAGTGMRDARASSVTQRALHEGVQGSPKGRQGSALRALAQGQGGLPTALKQGVEQLSGLSMDAVRVHYNSSKPAALQAHAYAQGQDIHLAPGQEQHLPHEAWHVVQQAQGRVRSTRQMAGGPVNDHPGLEQEADRLGARALALGDPAATRPAALPPLSSPLPSPLSSPLAQRAPIQRVELRLPNGSAAWVVDTARQFSDVMHWIDARAAHGDGRALKSLVDQLGRAHGRSAHDQLLLAHATLKWLDNKQQVGAKLPGLMKAANPGAIEQVGAYIVAQAAYQEMLVKNSSMAKIMSTHRSAGLEFEFATYQSDARLGSHVILAESAPLSGMFNLPFVLETDSGNELEIGFPPFLIRESAGTKQQIGALWQAMRATMARIRDANQGAPISELLVALQDAGIGSGWTIKNQAAAGMKVASARDKHASAEDKVYSQLNLSMGGQESGALINRFSRQSERYATASEKRLILPEFANVAGLLERERGAVSGMSDEIFVHLAKTVTNALAIPSIMFTGHGILQGLPVDGIFDLQSTVKELHGVWIKDSLPNILRTIDPTAPRLGAKLLARCRDELFAYVRRRIDAELTGEQKQAELVQAMHERLEQHLGLLRAPLATAIARGQAWATDAAWEPHRQMLAQLEVLDTRLQDFIAGDTMHLFDELRALHARVRQELARLRLFKETEDEPDHPEQIPEEERPKPNGPHADGHHYLSYNGDWTAANQAVAGLAQLTQGLDEFDGPRFLTRVADRFAGTVEHELDATIDVLAHSKAMLPPGSASFHGQEVFGTGLGVRKDTHIKSLPANKSVAELRGDQMIREYVGH